ncbi:MAG: N5-glutamine methyltransferase family protein, partial [Chloroflexota bacterium]
MSSHKRRTTSRTTSVGGSEVGSRIPSPGLSVGHALRQASVELGAVSDTPRVEAETLLMHVLDASRSSLLTHPEHPLTPGDLDEYRALVEDRALNVPLPYLTGTVEFYGLELQVSREVLIPRPDTEVLVDLALDYEPETIVDVGTGSGCIAVALAKHLPGATVYAIDISPAAVAVGRRNAERHGVERQIH